MHHKYQCSMYSFREIQCIYVQKYVKMCIPKQSQVQRAKTSRYVVCTAFKNLWERDSIRNNPPKNDIFLILHQAPQEGF